MITKLVYLNSLIDEDGSPLIKRSKLAQLNKKKIETVYDLLHFKPLHYVDYTHLVTLYNAEYDHRQLFKLNIISVSVTMGRKVPQIRAYAEQNGTKVIVICFNRYKEAEFKALAGHTCLIGGEYKVYHGKRYIVNPDIYTYFNEDHYCILPLYSKVTGMSDDYLKRIIKDVYTRYNYEDWIPQDIINKFNLISEYEMYNELHYPKSKEGLKRAYNRLIFEEVYDFTKDLVVENANGSVHSDIRINNRELYEKMLDIFPYSLTKDQSEIIKNIVSDINRGKKINALIQGDVGSGKTIVAFLLAALMAENGYQTAIMAPTGILAGQHYAEMKEYGEQLGLTVNYLGSDTKVRERRAVLKALADGEADIIIGTHSLISDDVQFQNLGLTIIDEEHKFGVVQREKLREKTQSGVNHISMTATPIPRSLTKTIYSDTFEVYNIKTMPAGRKPVQTAYVKYLVTAFRVMKKEIDKGHQCYVVCPMITESDSEKMKDVLSVEQVKAFSDKFFSNTEIKTGAVTGKMKAKEKEEIINGFTENKYQILIATSVVEVGVNVPNATVITIVNAERFGLASLHQLRGRVGRSSLQSYCMLQSDEETERINVMCKTNDGFVIAEEDMKLRGGGDLFGIDQSGRDKRLELVIKYPRLFNCLKDFLIKRSKELQTEAV